MIPSLQAAPNFDPIKDFIPVTRIATIPGIFVVPVENGPKTLQQLIVNAKANPGKYNYASAGLGSASSIGAELLKNAAGINLVHVPHKGLPEAHTSVMRADATLFMTFFSAGGELIQGGKLHAVAVTTAKRTPVLPNVPTVQEQGVAGFAYDPWFGILVAAGTPQAIVDQLAADFDAVSKIDTFKARFDKLGVDTTTAGPAEFAKMVTGDTERFVKIFGRAADRQSPAKAPEKK